MKRSARQETIIRALRRGEATTVGALMEEVSASRSTILRDLSALRDEGYVILAEQGRGGGLYLDPSSVQTTAKLTVTEAFALILGVSSMRAARVLPFGNLADSGLAKIEKALPPDTLRDLRRMLGKLYVGPLAPEVDTSNIGAMDAALLPAFEQAFLGRHLLSFDYRDAAGTKTQRRVEPQAMLILPPLWYLVAWDPARGDIRHFRMDRIRAPRADTATSFRVRHITFADSVEPMRYV